MSNTPSTVSLPTETTDPSIQADHETKMAEVGRTMNEGGDPQVSPDTSPEIPERPEGVPEKFWDAQKGIVNTDDLLKSYLSLEAKVSKGDEPPAVNKPAEDAKATEDEGSAGDEETAFTAERVTESIKGFSDEFAKNGELSDETITSLEASGIPREYTEAYVAGTQAQIQNHHTLAYDIVAGGVLKAAEAEFGKMVQWAQTNMPEAEFNAFNAAYAKPDQMAAAVKSVHAQYKEAMGSEGNLVTAGSDTSNVEVFKSEAEIVTAMADPKYKTDTAYRDSVAKKLRSSRAAGVLL